MSTIFVPLRYDTLLSNVRYIFTIAGATQNVLSSGVTQPSLSFPLFRILLEVPSGAEELLVYDESDSTNYNLPLLGVVELT